MDDNEFAYFKKALYLEAGVRIVSGLVLAGCALFIFLKGGIF
jgi:hypothetical protein